MRKMISLAMVMLIILSLFACNNEETSKENITSTPLGSSQNTNTQPPETTDLASAPMSDPGDNEVSEPGARESNILIAYFTRSDNVDREPDVDVVSRASFNVIGDAIYGNTELLARYIEEAIGGDLFSIRVTDPYPYDVDETIDDVRRGDSRTELAEQVENMEDYDIIFVGYPNWNATMPQPVFTFLESYDLAGKTVIPFSTHRGSRWGSSVQDLESGLPDSTILEGFVVGGDDATGAQDDINTWLESIDMK